jgi:hypothetical protein
MNTYTQDQLQRAKRHNVVTDNGVAYTWWLSGSEGASFALFREPRHTDEDIDRAKRWLRNNRDVVTIHIYKSA